MKCAIFLILFPIFQLHAKDIDYKINNQSYQGYIQKKSSSAPLVILIHDWDGLTQYEKKRSQMLFDLGYSVFSIDLFGKGIRPTEVKDKKQHTGELYKDRKKLRLLMTEALKVAKKNNLNTRNAVAIGYCFGGAATLELARSGHDLKGFATFHGGLETPEGQSYANTKGKIIVFHGTADSMVKMSHFASLADELEKEKVPHELVSYGGAPHAFTVYDSPRYQKDADLKSWKHFLSYLKEQTKGKK